MTVLSKWFGSENEALCFFPRPLAQLAGRVEIQLAGVCFLAPQQNNSFRSHNFELVSKNQNELNNLRSFPKTKRAQRFELVSKNQTRSKV